MQGIFFVILFGILLVAMIAVIAIIAAHFEKKRREALDQEASQMGLVFDPDGSEEFQAQLNLFQIFNLGRSRKLTNLIRGDSGDVRLSIFDYQYTTGSGKDSHTTKLTISVIESEDLRCPSFSLRPENILDRIGGLLGFQDIDFESHPKFSKLFVLKGPDAEAVRQFFKPALIEYFESVPGIVVEANPGTMLIHRSKLKKPQELKSLFAEAYEVYGRMIDG